MSVDDLMNVEVTSVSRKGQKLSDTAAAVFVITQDDIRRSAATSIPEVLRMVPGLDVARINGNVWAISARGSNGEFANKLLVMIDGRSVYNPLFSGVYWDVQDTLLEDVDRIEVIRGPGGTLWGANAVNGIINIITKHSIDTQGTLLTGSGGSTEGVSGAARYGGSFGHTGNYRVYGKSFDHPSSIGGVKPTHDGLSEGRAGFRADWDSRRGDNFTAQGDFYRGSAGTIGVLIDPSEPFTRDRASVTRITGQDLQFRWAAVQSSRSDTTVQAFYDYTARSDRNLVLGRRTFDIDFQHHWKLGSREDAVWGLEYRTSDDRANGAGLELVRRSNTANIASAFVQDDIEVTGRFHVIVGTKAQYDRASNLQMQPTLRVLYKVTERHTIWAAATSSVRTPDEAELYGRIDVGGFPDGTANGGRIVYQGDPELASERIASYEAGYRWQLDSDLGLDVTAFHNQMRNLAGSVMGQPFRDASGRTIIPLQAVMNGSGHSHGAEFLLTDALTSRWNIALGYSFFELYARDHSGVRTSPDPTPHNQFQLRSFVRLPSQFEIDSSAYYVGRIGTDIPAYLRLDGQISWHPAKRWSLSVSGQNLLQARHNEFFGTTFERQAETPVQRTVNGKITWRF